MKARRFKATVPVEWPASLESFHAAMTGKLPIATIETLPGDGPIEAPYPEIIPSWLSNGFEEVN